MQEKHIHLIKNLKAFLVGGMIPKLLSFIMIPLYTKVLAEAEYGVYDLIEITIQLLIPIMTFQIRDALLVFALDKNKNKKQVFSNSIIIYFGATLLIAVIAVVMGLLRIDGVKTHYLVFFVCSFATTSFGLAFSVFCKAIDKVKLVAKGSVINSVVTLFLNVIFLFVLKSGLKGFFIANSFGTIINCGYLFFSAKLYKYFEFKLDKKLLKRMLSISLPMVLSAVAWWVNNASDRYIVTLFCGVSASGLYAISYKIPNILSFFQTIFQEAWSVSAIKEYDKTDKDGFISNMFNMFSFAMILVTSFMLVFNIPIARVLYSDEFFEAWKYVPPLILAVFFNALTLFLGSVFFAVEDTKRMSLATSIGAIVNIVFNFLLVYKFGAYGAAIATLMGCFVSFVLYRVFVRQYIVLKVNNLRFCLAIIVLSIQMIIANMGVKAIPFQLILSFCLVAVFLKDLLYIANVIKAKIKNKDL